MADFNNKYDHSKMDHNQDLTQDPIAHAGHIEHSAYGMPQPKPGEHSTHTYQSGYEIMFRKRFWVSLLLSVPVLVYTPILQMWFGFRIPEFAGTQWIMLLFGIIVFNHGGVPDSHDESDDFISTYAAKTVCGGKINAPENYPSAMYKGEKIYFCTRACLRVFEQDPDPFIAGDVEHPQEDD